MKNICHNDTERRNLLSNKGILLTLRFKYNNPRDFKKSVDGAKDAVYCSDIIKLNEEKTALEEVLSAFEMDDRDIISSPYWVGFKITLDELEIPDFWDKALDYIIDTYTGKVLEQ